MSDISCNSGCLSGSEGSKNVLGRAAVALCGHDAGKIYFVVGVRDEGQGSEALLLADGKGRPAANPKAKKRKHVTVLRMKDDAIAEALLAGRRVDDSVIIHSLKKVKSDLHCDF